MTGRVTETEVGFAIMQLCAASHNGQATFDQMRRDLPKLLNLSPADKAPSTTRNGEELWEQQIRNVKSHSAIPGNPIYEGYLDHVPEEGYKITDKGQKFLKTSGP